MILDEIKMHSKAAVTLVIVLFTLVFLTRAADLQARQVHSAIPARDKPNVLFIAIDDLRANLGIYGDPLAVTPHIDRLAENSVVFYRHYVQQPSCAPSRTSMLTGLRPDEVEVINHNIHFRDTRPDVVTLPQLFKLNGYESVGIGKITHWQPGFQDSVSWHREYYSANPGREYQYALPENQTGGKEAATEKADVDDDAHLEGIFTNLAVDALESFRDNQTPFFLAVGYFRPHLPFVAPTRYWDMYDRDDFYPIAQPDRPAYAPEIAFHNNNELRGYNDIPDEGPLSIEKQMELRHGYYAAISFVDAQIGRLIDKLEELGLRENTIIVLWSDHGFHLGEQSIWGKSTNFELDAHSPMMISVPGMTHPGAVTGAFVESLDLYPTIVDLTGLEPQGTLSGRSLRPLLEDAETTWREYAFTQFPRPYGAAIGGGVPLTHMGYSVRVPEWRFTGWYNVETGNFDYKELYALDPDPEQIVQESNIESENLSGRPEYETIEIRLLEMVNNYRKQNYDSLN
jgi:iduronate 2-sulfatase